MRVLAVIVALLATACASVTGTRPPTVAAEVNGEVIPVSAVEEQLELARRNPEFAQQLEADPSGELMAQIEARIVDFLIRNALVVQGAQSELGITVGPDDVDARRQQLIDEQFGGDEAAFAQALEQAGFTDAEFRAQILPEVYGERVREALAAEVEVSDADLRAAYEEEYGAPRARHILVETREEALEVLDRLEQGEDFAELARELSTDPSAQQNAGDLGPIAEGQTVPPFEEAVYGAQVGEIVGPVETDFGFHVIERLPAPALAEVEDELRAELTQGDAEARFNDWLAEQYAQAEIVVNPRFGRWDPERSTVVPPEGLTATEPVVTPTPAG